MNDLLLQCVQNASSIIADQTDGGQLISITFVCGGVVITGKIISARDFLLSGQITDLISEAYDSALKKMGESKNSSGTDEILDKDFIHLKDARLLLGGQTQIPTNNVDSMFLRVPVTSISAYSFVSLNVVRK